MSAPIPTDGQQMLRQLVKDVDRLKRTSVVLRTTNGETGVEAETIYLSQPNVTEGAVFYQDVELMAESSAVGQAPGDGESILPPDKLWDVVPSDPLCTTNQQAVNVSWDGLGAGGEAIPATVFGVLEIHRSIDEFSDADPGGSTLVGVMTYPGTIVFTNQMYDVPYFYRFVLVSVDHRRSGQSNAVPGVAALTGLGDIDPGAIDGIINDAVDEAVDQANAYTDSVVVGAGGNSITMSVNTPSGTPKVGDLWFRTNGTGEIIGQWVGVAGTPNTWSPQTMNGLVLTNLQAGSITAGTLDAARIAASSITGDKIAANSIRARELLLADTSNMAEVNESYVVGTIFDTTHVITAGWSTRASTASTYFMFRDKQGPVPFKTGDRIRVTFDAYGDVAASSVSVLVWAYGAANVSDTVSGGGINITTTPTAFAVEKTLTADYSNKQTFLIGLSNLVGKNVYVRNVRAYIMNAGELIVDGTITARHIAAQSITTEKIALGAFSSNLVTDPSFEEPYPIVASTLSQDHQWCTLDMVGTGYVQRFNLPNSGLFAGRLGAVASGDAARVRSGIFPVTPGKSYVVALAIAKELNISVAGFYCRIAGGSTKALTEYPAGPFQPYIAFGGEDPNAFENIDPIWIGTNLYPFSLTTDADANGIHDGAVAYVSGTVTTGARSVSASGQVLSAASIPTGARWGTMGEAPVTPGIPHRLTLRYTGLAGTNARLRFYVDGIDLAGGGSASNITSAIASTASGTIVLNTPAGAVYDTYRVYAWLESASGTTATSLTATVTAIEIERVDATGTIDPILETYERRSGVFTVPAGINYCALRLSITGVTAAQSIFCDDVSVIEVGKGGTEITAAGVRLFGADGTEVGAFVSNRPDYISVTNGRDTLAAISQAGAISGQSLSIAGVDTNADGVPDKGFEIFGTEFLDWLDQLPRGVLAWENFGADNQSLTTETGYGEVGLLAEPGRLYKVSIRSQIENNYDATIAVRLRMTHAIAPAAAPDPKVTSPQLLVTQVIATAYTGVANDDFAFSDWTLFYNETPEPRNVRILLTMVGGAAIVGGAATTVVMRAAGGSVSTLASPEGGCMVCVEDVGPYRGQGGGYNLGGAAAPPTPPLQTYTTTWTSTTAVTYMGSGAKDSSQGASDMKQGYSSYDGDSKSLWIFPSSLVSTMATVASDANIIKVRIYLYANHWYNNAGGTALLKRHNYASAPGSSPSMTTLTSSSGWPKPGGRWVDITNASGVKAALRGGTFRGIGVGPAGTTSQTYYGRFNKAGGKIEVTYKK